MLDTHEVLAELHETMQKKGELHGKVRNWLRGMPVTNTQALGAEYLSKLVEHGCRECSLDKVKQGSETARGTSGLTTLPVELPKDFAKEERHRDADHAGAQPSVDRTDKVESVTSGRWRKGPLGRAVRKADTGDLASVNAEMKQALNHSPKVIAKVGNSYKKRLKVASRAEMFPKGLEQIQKQRDAMSKRKRWDKNTDEWKDHLKAVAKTKFGGTDSEWKRWCSEILEPYADRLWDQAPRR